MAGGSSEQAAVNAIVAESAHNSATRRCIINRIRVKSDGQQWLVKFFVAWRA